MCIAIFFNIFPVLNSLALNGQNFLCTVKNYWLCPGRDLHASITTKNSKLIFSSLPCTKAENNLKEESPEFNAGDGSKKNEAKKVIEKRCQTQGTRESRYL